MKFEQIMDERKVGDRKHVKLWLVRKCINY